MSTTTPDDELAVDGQSSITRLRVGHRCVLVARGEFDMSNADQLHAALRRAGGDGAAEVWLDLSEVAFIDSMGVRAILSARQDLGDGRAQLAIICPGGTVRRVLTILGVEQVIPVHATRAAAHAAG
jgi:anti-anti-sigma factor